MVLACASALALGGCQTVSDSLSDRAQRIYSGYAADPIDMTRDSKAGPLLDTLATRVKDIEKCYAAQYRPASGNADFCAGQRNQAIALLMTESTYLCTQHLAQIYGKEAAVNIAAGSIASLSSAVAAISPVSRARAFSALSSFSSAERALINETIYKNMLTTAIATKIEEMRSAGGKALLARKAARYDDYRIEDALSDVLDYHGTCAFHRGLEQALREGTNVNPYSKRLSAEVKATELQNRIDARATILGLDNSAKQRLLDPKTGVGDPIMKSLVEQYQANAQELASAAQAAAGVPKAAAAAGIPSLDIARTDIPDPLGRLKAAIEAVARGPADAAAAMADDGRRGDQDVPRAYLENLKKAIDIAVPFRDSLRTALLPSASKDVIDGTITKALADFDEVQRLYRVGKAKLDPAKLADQQQEVQLEAEVNKKVLVLKQLVGKVAGCESAALKRIDDSIKAELAKMKALDAEAFAALAGALLDDPRKPAWSNPDTTRCLQ